MEPTSVNDSTIAASTPVISDQLKIPKIASLQFMRGDGVYMGTVRVLLFKNTPITSLNFGTLCHVFDTLQSQNETTTSPPQQLSYLNTVLHRNDPQRAIYGGDITFGKIDPLTLRLSQTLNPPGYCSTSVYPTKTFEDEHFGNLFHVGCLAAAPHTTSKPNSNTALFFFAMNDLSLYQNKSVVFGTVLDNDSFEVLQRINAPEYNTEDINWYDEHLVLDPQVIIYISHCQVDEYWSYEELIIPGAY